MEWRSKMKRLLTICATACILGVVLTGTVKAGIVFPPDDTGWIIISTDDTETLDGLAFQDGSLVKYYLPPVDVAVPFIDEDWFGFIGYEDIDAFDILDNGHIILSTDTDAELAGLMFRDGDLVEVDYDPVACVVNTATLFFSEDLFNADENIDAVDVLANGHIILSTTSPAKLGGCLFEEGDLAEYDPMTGLAMLFLDQDQHFSDWPWPDIDAVQVLANGHIILSTSNSVGDVWIGGLIVRNGDLIDYDPVNKTASILLNKDWFVNADFWTNIDAVYVVPEPSMVLLLGLGSLALLRQRRT